MVICETLDLIYIAVIQTKRSPQYFATTFFKSWLSIEDSGGCSWSHAFDFLLATPVRPDILISYTYSSARPRPCDWSHSSMSRQPSWLRKCVLKSWPTPASDCTVTLDALAK